MASPGARSGARGARLWTKTMEVDPVRHLKLSLIEDPTEDVDGDAWCAWCLWPAAKVLMAYLATLEDQELKEKSSPVAGEPEFGSTPGVPLPTAERSVLELGAGCGAVGMYAALRGAMPVVLTDVESALPLLRRNLAQNCLGSRCCTCPLFWGTPLHRLAEPLQQNTPFDWALAADCSYDFVSPEIPSSIDALLCSAQLAKRALICVSRRRNEVEAFLASVERAGIQAEVVHSQRVDEAKEGAQVLVPKLLEPVCLVRAWMGQAWELELRVVQE
ncbi:unnamed protein product [Durusdinium trenchii]|uniref:Protein-lysine N-methyltransferase EFM6 (Elongation factor methyltransferase 6) n=2 Tax=Durusdinium trenchii TaxID=1381693 RepID=A0ABP0KZD7_9DINO